MLEKFLGDRQIPDLIKALIIAVFIVIGVSIIQGVTQYLADPPQNQTSTLINR